MTFRPPLFSYRAVPARYVTKAELRAGMDAQHPAYPLRKRRTARAFSASVAPTPPPG
jgi:hypothetical protein